MAINGIHSYGMGYYNYQASINNIRLTQALTNNPRFNQMLTSPVASKNTSLKSSMDFVKRYTTTMSDLMSAANELKTTNKSGAMSDLIVTSSNSSVASVTEKLPVRRQQEIELNVEQLAQAQMNASNQVVASDKAQSDMNFSVANGWKSLNVNVSATKDNGLTKTNAEMLQEAAAQINTGHPSIRANVIQKDGKASLELVGLSTGEANSFQVTGKLGAAEGVNLVKTAASDARYTVTSGGRTTTHKSQTNDIRLDNTRIGVTLKDTGKTTIQSGADSAKVADALGNLVNKYNDSLKLLNDNYERGSGVDKQLRNLVQGLGSEESLKKLGITVNKDATLKFDRSTFEKNMKEDPKFTQDLISGTSGIANKAFSKAIAGMNVPSGSLINGDLSNAESEAMSSPYNMFSMYSRNGAYTMNNYYAVGMMMNYLI